MGEISARERAIILAKAARRIREIRDAEACEESLAEFYKQSFPHFDPANFVDNWHLHAVAEHLEAVSYGVINRLLINVPPRTGKTGLCSICFPAWVWAQREKEPLRGPQVSFFYASYAEQLSLEHSLKTRRLVESRWYKTRWGKRFSLVSDRNTKGHFENDKGGYRMASSVDARATGFGADILVADDPHLIKEAESDPVRRGVVQWWTETMPSRLNDRRTGAMIVVMQRVHEEDLSGYIIAQELGYEHLMLPMRCDEARIMINGARFETAIGFVDPREDGDLLWPDRLPEVEVVKLEKELGPYGCNPYEAPVLMADLSLRPIGEIRAGDDIIGFDKKRRPDTVKGRYKLTRTLVTQVHVRRAPVVKMLLASGEIIRCTRDHKWFTKDRGTDREQYLPVTLGRSRLARICPPRLPVLSHDEQRLAGWVSGYGALGAKFIKAREKVVSIEPDGEENVYALTTTTGNYVVWGLASSNSAGQLQQSPEPRGGGILKRDWWKLWDDEVGAENGAASNTYPKCEFILASLDTAYTEDKENDFSAMSIWGVWRDRAGNPNIILMLAWQERLQFHELVMRVAACCKKYRVDRLLIEDKAAGHSVSQEVRRLFGTASYGIELFNPRDYGDKVARVHAIVHLFSEGLIYAPDKQWAQDVIDQSAIFPRGSHDDLVDTVSQALLYLRRTGLIVRREERTFQAEEDLKFVPRAMPLYPV